MGNTPSSRKISAQDRAILDMKNQRDKLHQYQRRITVITNRETEIARECVARGDRPKALLALRRKKFQETLLAKTDAQLETLEQLTANVEFALVQKDVIFGLQQGTSVLKQINAEMGGVQQVEKLLGDNEEARQYQEEISEMLAGQMSNQDEDEVEEELEAMEKGAEAQVKKAVTLPEGKVQQRHSEATFPVAPDTEPVSGVEVQATPRTAERRSEEVVGMVPA